MPELRAMVSVYIDDDAWGNAQKDIAGTDGLLGWAFVCAGEQIMDGKRTGEVTIGYDPSPVCGTWTAY